MNKSKHFRLVIAIILSLAIVVCGIIPQTSTVSTAATIKLSVTNVSLAIGKTKTLHVIGTKKTVKWSTNNSKIATVSKNGKVTAIAVGRAVVTATVSGKKLNCNVVVKDGFNASEAASKIIGTFTDTSSGVVAIFENTNKYAISMTATMVFYDSNGAILSKSTYSNFCFESGNKCAYYFTGPKDSGSKGIPYASFKVIYDVEGKNAYADSNLSDIKTESNFGTDNVMVSVKNTGNEKADLTQISVVFYKDGKAISSEYQYADVSVPGSEDIMEFSFPYDSNYETIQPDTFEVYVNFSYQ